MRSRVVHWVQAHAWELGLSVLLFAVALAVRLPNLMLVPRFTDEGLEVLWGLQIAQGPVAADGRGCV